MKLEISILKFIFFSALEMYALVLLETACYLCTLYLIWTKKSIQFIFSCIGNIVLRGIINEDFDYDNVKRKMDS